MRYKIVGIVVVGVIAGREQADLLVGPDDGLEIEDDGKGTLFLVRGNERQETTTTPNAIGAWLANGQVSLAGG